MTFVIKSTIITIDLEFMFMKDTNHVITNEENQILFDYFKNDQDEEIENISGKTVREAANIIGPKDYEEETLQHILTVLFPNKYKAYY